MSRFSKDTKQKIIDDYLNQTGRNLYVPEEFVAWLKPQPDHEAYDLFHGMGDEEAANNYRIDLARRFASGLRITIKTEIIESEVRAIKVTEYPAFISPRSTRREGGGYVPFNPDDEISQSELRKQAGIALAGWLNRYRGCAENIGLDMDTIEEMVRVLRDDKEEAA